MSFSFRCRGISLVEVLVALGMLSVGIYGIAEAVQASRHSGRLACDKARAVGLAELKLEEVCASAPQLARGAAGEISLPANGTTPFEQNPRYVWRSRLKPAQGGPVEVSVEVLRAADAKSASPAALARLVATVPGGAK